MRSIPATLALALSLAGAHVPSPASAQYVPDRWSWETREPGHCPVIECAVTDESHQRRLRELLVVVHAGIAAGMPLSWA